MPGARRRPDGPRKELYLGGAEAHGGLVAAAAAAGMRPHDALAAASWAAREYLGLPGLEPGAPADAADPRVDLTQLTEPTAVILRGRCVRG